MAVKLFQYCISQFLIDSNSDFAYYFSHSKLSSFTVIDFGKTMFYIIDYGLLQNAVKTVKNDVFNCIVFVKLLECC